MEDWIKLLNNGIDTYNVGQQLYEAKTKEVKRSAYIEISKVSSILLIGILLIAGLLMVVTTVIVSATRCIIELIDYPLLQYLTPVGLALIFVAGLVYFRKNLYLYFTRKIAVELLT